MEGCILGTQNKGKITSLEEARKEDREQRKTDIEESGKKFKAIFDKLEDIIKMIHLA